MQDGVLITIGAGKGGGSERGREVVADDCSLRERGRQAGRSRQAGR